jgi:hypothetical protein
MFLYVWLQISHEIPSTLKCSRFLCLRNVSLLSIGLLQMLQAYLCGSKWILSMWFSKHCLNLNVFWHKSHFSLMISPTWWTNFMWVFKFFSLANNLPHKWHLYWKPRWFFMCVRIPFGLWYFLWHSGHSNRGARGSLECVNECLFKSDGRAKRLTQTSQECFFSPCTTHVWFVRYFLELNTFEQRLQLNCNALFRLGALLWSEIKQVIFYTNASWTYIKLRAVSCITYSQLKIENSLSI